MTVQQFLYRKYLPYYYFIEALLPGQKEDKKHKRPEKRPAERIQSGGDRRSRVDGDQLRWLAGDGLLSAGSGRREQVVKKPLLASIIYMVGKTEKTFVPGRDGVYWVTDLKGQGSRR